MNNENDFDMLDKPWDDHKSAYDRMGDELARKNRIETLITLGILAAIIMVFWYLG